MELIGSSSLFSIEPSALNEVLKDGPRKKVLSFISLVGNVGASFKEIAQGTGISPSTLAYHLKVLLGSSLIKKGLKDRTGRRDYSVYTLTDSGSKVVKVLGSLMDRGVAEKGPLTVPVRMPELFVTYMTIGPRCIVVTERKR